MGETICQIEKFDGDVFGRFQPPLQEEAITDAIYKATDPSEFVPFDVTTGDSGVQDVVVRTSHLPAGRDAHVREGIRLALQDAYTTAMKTNS